MAAKLEATKWYYVSCADISAIGPKGLGEGSYVLHELVSYSCIYEVRMSPALNGSSTIRRFKHSNAIEIREGIIFDFYTGLPHIVTKE